MVGSGYGGKGFMVKSGHGGQRLWRAAGMVSGGDSGQLMWWAAVIVDS
jgi:hypothetical protein